MSEAIPAGTNGFEFIRTNGDGGFGGDEFKALRESIEAEEMVKGTAVRSQRSDQPLGIVKATVRLPLR